MNSKIVRILLFDIFHLELIVVAQTAFNVFNWAFVFSLSTIWQQVYESNGKVGHDLVFLVYI